MTDVAESVECKGTKRNAVSNSNKKSNRLSSYTRLKRRHELFTRNGATNSDPISLNKIFKTIPLFMPTLISSLRNLFIATLLTSACFADPEVSTRSSSTISAATPEEPLSLDHPIFMALEARTVQGDAAVGAHLATPIYTDAANTVLLEGYQFEGEGELAVLGGGIVFRRGVGQRGSVEASAFFEGLRSTDGFSYPQLGAGLGYSPNRWIAFRGNGYLPLKSKDYRKLGTQRWSEIEGSGSDQREVSFSREYGAERAPMRGFDVEMEFRLPEPPRWVDPRLAIGYAYREADDRSEVYSGMTTRAELHFAKHWVVEGEWRQDMAGVDQEWRAGVRFQILFGGPAGRDEESSQDANNRAGERFLPVERFPWPTLARGVSHGKTKQGDSRSLAKPASAPASASSDDCCPSGNSPLIFN